MIFGTIMLRKLDAGAVAVLLMVLVEHVLLRNAVKKYYATHLPHYDSIGSYTFAYDVLNAYANEGWWAAIKLATGFGLSLTQPMFAAVFAPFLSPTPESLLTYNSLCLGLLSWSLYALCRGLGCGPLRAIAAAALPLVPDTFYWWSGGLQDWQRDPSYFCLLASSFFLFFRHVLVRTPASGAILGIAIALTITSRDTAPGYVVMVIGPLFLVWFVALTRSERLRANWPTIALPLVIAACGGAIYAAFMLKHALLRFSNVYVVYAFGSGFMSSVKAQWMRPFQLIVGVGDGLGAAASTNLSVTMLIAYLALFLASAGVWKLGLPALQRTEVRFLLIAGFWAFAFTMLNLLAVVGIGGLSFQETKPMFYPTLLLFLAAGVALIVSIKGTPSLAIAAVTTLIFCSALVLAIPSRIKAKTFDQDPAHLAALPVLMKLARERSSAIFAFFWHDGINPDVLSYYAAQGNVPKPRKLTFVSQDGYGIDMAIGVPERMNVGEMRNEFLKATLCRADYIVLTPKVSWYERDAHHMFIFRHGRPIVERIMNLLESKMVYEYMWFGVPLRVYDNIERQHCETREPKIAQR